jgi:hypothetical protein
MKNLDLIKNINKQNRIGSQERRRSLSSQKRYKSGEARSAKGVSPNHSQSKSFDMGKQKNKKSRQSNLDTHSKH